jgi:hypothetical protein
MGSLSERKDEEKEQGSPSLPNPTPRDPVVDHENVVNDPNDINYALRERERKLCYYYKLQLCNIARLNAEFQKAEIDFPGLSDRYSKTEVIDHVMRDIVTSEEAIKGSPELPLPHTRDITRKKGKQGQIG